MACRADMLSLRIVAGPKSVAQVGGPRAPAKSPLVGSRPSCPANGLSQASCGEV